MNSYLLDITEITVARFTVKKLKDLVAENVIWKHFLTKHIEMTSFTHILYTQSVYCSMQTVGDLKVVLLYEYMCLHLCSLSFNTHTFDAPVKIYRKVRHIDGKFQKLTKEIFSTFHIRQRKNTAYIV